MIMLDNASYHRGVPTMHQIESLRLPVLFLGPYHFRMAPVEMLFNYIKSHDLNPLKTRLTSRYAMRAHVVGSRWSSTSRRWPCTSAAWTSSGDGRPTSTA